MMHPEATTSTAATSEKDNKTLLRQLVSEIPLDAPSLYAMPIDWPLLHQHRIVQEHLHPWVVQKIVGYLGTFDYLIRVDTVESVYFQLKC